MIDADYKILRGNTREALEKEVVEYLNKGYIPAGGVRVDPWPHKHFTQAVYKVEHNLTPSEYGRRDGAAVPGDGEEGFGT